ncbi:MAG: efflux RND transporter permease subunit [Vicinamibacterales bacterium]
MLEKAISFSLHNRAAAWFAVVLVAGAGSWGLATIPIDAFPDVTNVQVEVVSTAPGLSPLEVETSITYPIEMAMRGLPSLVLMRSTTKAGISVITLVFEDRTDIYFARQQVHERLAEVGEQLPSGVETEMGPIATAMGEIYQYTLEPADGRHSPSVEELTALRTIQDWVVGPLLKSVPGVTEVNSFGGYIQQYEVVVAPDKLIEYDLSIAAIKEAIDRNNQNVGGNVANRESEQFIIRGVGLVQSPADIAAIVLRSEGGTPVTIGDVAEVRLGHAVRQGASAKNGDREVVGGIVMMLRGENSRRVVGRLQERVREINEGGLLPGNLKLVPFYERSLVVDQSIRTVLKALGEGSILVLLVLIVLLRSVRGALIVIAALPLSALLTFAVMKATGLDANLMSLGGLAISIGMIVDTTIIQVENVQRHLASKGPGENRLKTVFNAVMEVRKPSIFGELIIALTFIPIITLQGMEGKMFSPLAYTVALALLSSLLLSIFVIPMFCLVGLGQVHLESPIVRALRRLYRPVLEWALDHRVAVFTGATVLILGSAAVVPRLGTEFLPVIDEGAFDMDIQLLPGISLDKAMETSMEVERRLMRFPELTAIVSRTGQTGVALEARSVDKTGFVGALKPRSEWVSAGSRDELWEKMREAISDIPGMAASFSQPIQCRIDELVAGTRAQVIVKLFGDDPEVLERTAGRMAAVLEGVSGVADLVVERVAGQHYITISVDRARLARYGLNVADVLGLIETAIGGRSVSKVYAGNRVTDVAVRFPEQDRASIEALGNLLVEAPGGHRVPVAQVADVKVVEGPVQISRENGLRRIGVEVNVSGRDIGSFVAEAQEALRENVPLPPGYYFSWGGQFESQQKAMRRLAVIMPAVAALIFVLLLLTFNSVRLALLVIFNLPFAMVGGVLALWLTGLYLSVPASVGFIVLFGVAVLNGLVLTSQVASLRGHGVPLRQAIVEGCDARLRPVLMTAAISVLSLVPMMLAAGPGAEVQRPLAVVVSGGLVTSTFLTLLVLPVLYGPFEGGRPALLPGPSQDPGCPKEFAAGTSSW